MCKSMSPLIVLKYFLAGEAEFSDILKGKQGNCALPEKTPHLSLCAGFHSRQGKSSQNLASVFLFGLGNPNK